MPEPRTITEAAEFIRRGELTPSDLLEQCLARIDRYEPQVRAWVLVDRDGAREQAERLTAELHAGQKRGPLHGIPIGIKDIIDVFDLPTGCGSKLWANSIARKDATVVTRLRQAGAIIMGKTVTTAYASFDPPVTRNPWNLERTPGGSSSGSAAAVACGMCLGALATQTGGSITRPAAYCGVCSIKPTYGRVSLDGVLGLAPSMDHMGCMANSVRDLAIIFQVIADNAKPDSTFMIDRRLDPNCKKLPPRYGRLRGHFEEMATSEMREVLDHTCRELTAPDLRYMHEFEGYNLPVKNLVPPPSFADILRQHRRIMAIEAAAFHRNRLRRHPEDYPPRISGLLEEGLRHTALEYQEALESQKLANIEIDELTESKELYLLTPATTEPAPTADTTGDPAMNSPWSFTGSPTVSIPMGWSSDGMPLSMQITGSSENEDYLLTAAAWAERIIHFTPRPLPL